MLSKPDVAVTKILRKYQFDCFQTGPRAEQGLELKGGIFESLFQRWTANTQVAFISWCFSWIALALVVVLRCV